MSPDGQIVWDRDDHIGVALIDRPARRNALSAALCDALRVHLEGNRDLRVVVVGGAGDKAFCAGADLARRAEDTGGGLTHGGGDSFRPAFEQLLDAICQVTEVPEDFKIGVDQSAARRGLTF